MARQYTELERFRMAQAAKEPFDLPMVADSTAEVAVDITTGIDEGEGWALLGWYWSFRNIAAPHVVQFPKMAVDVAYQMQLCRGQAPATPVLLDPHDDDLIWEDIFCQDAGATNAQQWQEWPRYVNCAEVTIQDSCYMMFGTSADDPAISLTTIGIMGVVLYEEMGAPNLGQGKGGYLGNM